MAMIPRTIKLACGVNARERYWWPVGGFAFEHTPLGVTPVPVPPITRQAPPRFDLERWQVVHVPSGRRVCPPYGLDPPAITAAPVMNRERAKALAHELAKSEIDWDWFNEWGELECGDSGEERERRKVVKTEMDRIYKEVCE